MTTEAPESGKTTTDPAPAAATAPKATLVTEAEGQPATEVSPKKEPVEAGEAKFDLKLPDGSLLTADAVEKAVARAKELKLSPEQAQADLNRESDMVKSFVEAEKTKLAQSVDAWVTEAKNDSEIGGEKFPANAEIAKRVVNRFGTEEFRKALNETGLGNHPELFRVFVRIGKAMTEDQLVLPSGQTTAPKSPAEVLYGDTSTKEK